MVYGINNDATMLEQVNCLKTEIFQTLPTLTAAQFVVINLELFPTVMEIVLPFPF